MTIPQLRAPIILVHGLFGFDRFRVGKLLSFDYFRGIPAALERAGNRVHVARLSPIGGVARRAEQLRAFLDQHAADTPVHLIAHSMGGLDSRYLITRLGMADRVLTLTTLGSPHRGCAFADFALNHFVPYLAPLFTACGLTPDAFADLSTDRCAAFNRDTPDAPGVRYFSVAGRYDGCWLNPSWHLTAPIVERAEGPNDGIVSIASATWGESCEVWECDHLNLVNWPQPGLPAERNDRLPSYATLLGRLRAEGY
ncbi:MAG: hypothetical protein U0736_26880 [Gemmataceae bacterium]